MQSSVKKHPVMRDGLFTFVWRIANVAFAIALGVLTARVLGPTGKGLYALPMVQAGLVAVVFGGLSSATSYYLLNRQAGRHVVRAAAVTATLFVVAASIVVAGVAALGGALWAAPAAILSLPASAMVFVVTGYVMGIKRVRFASTLTLAGTLLTLATTATGLFAIARTPFVAIVAWVASTTAVAAIAWIAMVIHARTLPQGKPVRLPSFIALASRVGAAGAATELNYRGDLYVVALLLPPASLGLYSVASSASQSVLLPTQAMAIATSPHIGSLDPRPAARLAARCARNNLLISLIVCGTLFALAPWVVQLLYGAAFLPLVPALRVLLVGIVALSVGSPISSYYTLKLAKPEVPLVLAGISAALCIACAIVLVPHTGIIGAAIASTIGYTAGQGLGVFYFSRQARVPLSDIILPTREDFRRYREFAAHIWKEGFHIARASTTP